MSDFLWSRQALLAGASAIDTLVLVMAAIVLLAGSLAAWRAWTAAPLVIRWWAPIPEQLERADAPYGAKELQEAYPDALRRGVTSAGAVHIVLAILAMLALALRPAPEREHVLRRVKIRFDPPPPRVVTQEEGGSRGRSPALKLPDPRRAIPTPIETHVIMPDMEDLLTAPTGIEDGSIFGEGDGDGEDDSGIGGPEGPGFDRNALADPDPRDIIPVDQLPELIWMAAPIYPEMARLAGLEGVVELRLLVDTDGRVRKSRVDRSISGLDEAALAAAATARFKPALWQGKPVKVWVALPIRFSLH